MTVTRTGPARPADVWAHYEQLDLWSTWAPHLTRVRSDARTLRPGARGTVTAVGLVPVPFRVLTVQPSLWRWSWRVRLGPVALLLEHNVAPAAGGGCRAGVTVHGPAPVLLAYRPLMSWALRRLVRVRPPPGDSRPPARHPVPGASERGSDTRTSRIGGNRGGTSGAPCGARTHDPWIKSPLLYQLS